LIKGCGLHITGMAVAAFVVFVLGLAELGCGGDAEHPSVVGVSPALAYTDGAVVLRVDCAHVRPAVRVDVRHGSLTADLSSLKMSLIPEVSADESQPEPLETAHWDGGDSYWVRTAPALAAGRYALALVDPRGHATRFSDAFQALGPDTEKPTINPPTVSVSPDTEDPDIIVVGGQVTAQIVADDGQLGIMATIEWSAENVGSGTCPLSSDPPPRIQDTPPHQMSCVASFVAPALDTGDTAAIRPFLFRVTARDIAGNVADLDVPLRLAKVPLIYSFSDSVGALGGYQPFVVRGQHFLPESRVYIGGAPIVGGIPGGTRLDNQSIVGWTPPHDRAEALWVEVRSPAGKVSSRSMRKPFTYLAPPRPRDIQPPVGPARGGIMVTVRGNDFRTGMVVYVGAQRGTRQPLSKPRLVTQNQVVGCLPPGAVGPASIWAYDPVSGDGELESVFTYQDDTTSPPSLDPNCQ
jgi:hypothetical protein